MALTATPAPTPGAPTPASNAPAMTNGEATQGLRRRRETGPRALPKPTPVYFVFQVLDDSGQPTPFNKSKLKVLAIERNTDKVLDIIEGDDHEYAVYVRGMLAPARMPGSGAQSG